MARAVLQAEEKDSMYFILITSEFRLDYFLELIHGDLEALVIPIASVVVEFELKVFREDPVEEATTA